MMADDQITEGWDFSVPEAECFETELGRSLSGEEWTIARGTFENYVRENYGN